MSTRVVQPLVAQPKPRLVELERGRAYFWCAWGRSGTQPFCDGSHPDGMFVVGAICPGDNPSIAYYD